MKKMVHQRFEAQVAPPNEKGCRIWKGIVKAGRGMFVLQNRPLKWMSAAKWAYQFYVEPVPKGFHVQPRCKEPLCVEHLKLMSQSEITKRAIKRGTFVPFPDLHKYAPHFRGEKNRKCRYPQPVVEAIRAEHTSGVKIQVIAMQRKMPVSTVWWLCAGRFVPRGTSEVPKNEPSL